MNLEEIAYKILRDSPDLDALHDGRVFPLKKGENDAEGSPYVIFYLASDVESAPELSGTSDLWSAEIQADFFAATKNEIGDMVDALKSTVEDLNSGGDELGIIFASCHRDGEEFLSEECLIKAIMRINITYQQ